MSKSARQISCSLHAASTLREAASPGFWALVLCCLSPLGAAAQQTDYLWPDLTPLVREDLPFLSDWHIDGDELRLDAAVANIGLGLMQLRTDAAGTGGPQAPVTQRVFIGTDNGPVYEDFAVGSALNFHHAHLHIHFEDFAEYGLYEVVADNHILQVGDLASRNVKASFNLVDYARIPGPQFVDNPQFPSSNRGRFQNISAGSYDYYSDGVIGQFVPIAGLEKGFYWLRQTVDPTNVLRELDDSNNSLDLLIHLDRPGEAMRRPDGSFVRPGDFFALVQGDLNGDGVVDVVDWTKFRDAAGAELVGLEDADLYQRGDLNFDHLRSPADFLLFKQYFDAAQGEGAFAAMLAVPEPASLVLLALAGLLATSGRRTHGCSPIPASRTGLTR